MDINKEIKYQEIDFNNMTTGDILDLFDYLKSLAKEHRDALSKNRKFSDEEWRSLVDTACSIHKEIVDIHKAIPERQGGNLLNLRGSLASMIASKRFKSNSTQNDTNIKYIKDFYQEIIRYSNLPEAE